MNRNLKEPDEVGLLDLLILIAENKKLLVIGAMLAGMIAAGLAHLVPQSYVSHATVVLPTQAYDLGHVYAAIKVQTPPQAAELMTSPRVLDPVIVRLKLAEGSNPDSAREELMSRVKAAASPDGLLRLDVSAPTPELAQTQAGAILDSWLQSTEPTEEERKALKKLLAHGEASLDASRRMIERLTQEAGSAPGKAQAATDTSAALLAAADLQTRYLRETTEVSRLLQGFSTSVVKQAPTRPNVAEAMPKGLIALLSALATTMGLVLWILVVHAWRSAAQDPNTAPKLLRLRNALGLK